MFEKKVFVSHSSRNKEIADALSVYLTQVGVKSENIFCSSVVGQGINNGKELGATIFNTIAKSKLIIYLISQDFLDSPFCIEELGIGWFLAQKKKRTCFYLLLPDVAPDDMRGLINKSIQQFLLLDLKDHKQFDQFAQDILSFFSIRRLNIASLSRVKENFFNTIEPHCKKLIDAKNQSTQEKETANNLVNELQDLKKKYQDQKELYRKQIADSNEESNRNELLVELSTIENLLHGISYVYGLSKDVYSKISKAFWFDTIHRYNELLKLTSISPSDMWVELLAATLYAIEGDYETAKKHITNSFTVAITHDQSLHSYMFKNFFEVYTRSLVEIIKILEDKLLSCKAGLLKDSYASMILILSDREKTIN